MVPVKRIQKKPAKTKIRLKCNFLLVSCDSAVASFTILLLLLFVLCVNYKLYQNRWKMISYNILKWIFCERFMKKLFLYKLPRTFRVQNISKFLISFTLIFHVTVEQNYFKNYNLNFCGVYIFIWNWDEIEFRRMEKSFFLKVKF